MNGKTGMRVFSLLTALLLVGVGVVSAVSAQDVTGTLPADSSERSWSSGILWMYSSRVLHRYPICEHPESTLQKS